MSFSIMTQCLPGMFSSIAAVHYVLVAEIHLCILYLYVLFSSGIVHITGVPSDGHLGQREAQSLQQRVQGLSQRPDGHYPPGSLILIKTKRTIVVYSNVFSQSSRVLH